MSGRPSNNFRTRRRGLSLVEIMVALAITATLLTAAAVAFNASSAIVTANDEFFRATQAARVSMHQILTQVRRGSVNTAWNATTLRLITAANDDGSGEDDITYSFVSADKKLKLITNDVLTDPDYVLASNVSDLKFGVEIGEDYTKAPCVVRVTVSITVRVGDNVVTLSGSAAPRRNLVY
jgi:prepilin-type N-terminal cleavage/methylation domain-containing protein